MLFEKYLFILKIFQTDPDLSFLHRCFTFVDTNIELEITQLLVSIQIGVYNHYLLF